jgi:hypothetical protein
MFRQGPMVEREGSRISGVRRLSGRFLHVLVVILVSICGRAMADEQSGWQELINDAYPQEVRKVLKVYGVTPTCLASMRFKGMGETIEDALLFRASDDSNCASASDCWYILLPNEHAQPIVTKCDFIQGSLPHHFNRDRSNFFVFDFSCSNTRMQIQVSKGQSFVVVGK